MAILLGNSVSTSGPSVELNVVPPTTVFGVQATVSGSSSVTMALQGSLDNVNYADLAAANVYNAGSTAITATDAIPGTEHVGVTSTIGPVSWIRLNITATASTGALTTALVVPGQS